MTAGVLRTVRVEHIAVSLTEPGSMVRPCAHCGAAVAVAPQSIRYAPELRPVCDVCLPAEPVTLGPTP